MLIGTEVMAGCLVVVCFMLMKRAFATVEESHTMRPMTLGDLLPRPVRGVVRRALLPIRQKRFDGSADYWERRYATGGNSGAGSYGAVAQFKADQLNRFVADNDVQSVIELGCGDGHQLSLAEYPRYFGTDVSASVIEQCRRRFAGDTSKQFAVADAVPNTWRADLALSLDVLLHLVENDVYDAYLRDLFARADRFVGIFAADREDGQVVPHVRFRRFTEWVAANQPEWRLIETVENPHKGPDSFADFYFYAAAV